MKVTYSNRRLEKQCTQEKEKRKAFNRAVAGSLGRRVNELMSAENIGDVLDGPGRWEVLTGDRDGQISGRLSPNDRLIVEVACRDALEGEDQMALIRAATDVEVIEIVDYH
jgi:proteic killer suppression protein